METIPDRSAATCLGSFKRVQARLERHTGHLIKYLRTDGGTEYMGTFLDYLESQTKMLPIYPPTFTLARQSVSISPSCLRLVPCSLLSLLHSQLAPKYNTCDALLLVPLSLFVFNLSSIASCLHS
jgi:hypothetical protein